MNIISSLRRANGRAFPEGSFIDKVKGGDLYGLQPALGATALDADGNMRFTTDFRSVYATLLDRWLPDGDSIRVLTGRFEPLGFL